MITIIGSGLTGATCARILQDHNIPVVVFESQNKVGGNVRTPIVKGVPIHLYGPHIFHTHSSEVWEFVQRFCQWKPYVYNPGAFTSGRLYSFPPNLGTVRQITDGEVQTEGGMRAWLHEETENFSRLSGQNLEEQLLRTVGATLYNIFFKDYSIKQWGLEPKQLLPSLASRVPLNFGEIENYFPTDPYQAIPIGGYSSLIAGLLQGVEVECVDAVPDKGDTRVVYTGKLDRLFAYDNGRLHYRSLAHRHVDRPDMVDYQQRAVVNYCDNSVDYTRIIEHWHFLNEPHTSGTLITYEYPCDYIEGLNAPMYPMPTAEAQQQADSYRQRAKELKGILVGGRLGEYRYYNMDQAILRGMQLAKQAMERWK